MRGEMSHIEGWGYTRGSLVFAKSRREAGERFYLFTVLFKNCRVDHNDRKRTKGPTYRYHITKNVQY